MVGWLGVVSGSARLDREGTNSSWQRQKPEAKLEEQFCSIVLQEPELELFFPQTPKATYKEKLWKLAVQ